MLKADTIPKTEPKIRVGIILTEDKQKAVDLDLRNSSDVKIVCDNIASKQLLKTNLKINVVDGKLLIDGETFSKISLFQENPDDFITVNKVIAGRGFHWAKYIEVKLTHSLELSVVEGDLMLINEMPLEDYLACVATSEMSAECPDSYIEAQTIVARSWMLANVEQKHVNLGFDVCNDDCCQRFQGINNLTEHSKRAAHETKGLVLMSGGEIVDARYSKSCGGIMEKFENLWENTPKSYMQNKSDAKNEFNVDLTVDKQLKKWVEIVPKSYCSPHYIKEEELHKYLGNVDEQGKYFRWTIETTQEELVQNIKDKLDLDIKYVLELNPLKRAGSGRLLELEIMYLDNSGIQKSIVIFKDYEVRRVLHKMFLYSSAIDIIIDNKYSIPKSFTFYGAGWGHGAGLCQIGALGMSLAGINAKDIVFHYYPGVELVKIY